MSVTQSGWKSGLLALAAPLAFGIAWHWDLAWLESEYRGISDERDHLRQEIRQLEAIAPGAPQVFEH